MMNRKIMMVSAQYYPHVGGIEQYVYNLSAEITKMGHSVIVVTSEAQRERAEKDDGNIIRLPSWQMMKGRFPVLKPGKKSRDIMKWIKDQGFDLIMVHGRFYTLSLWGTAVARRCGIPCVVLDHGTTHLNTGNKITTKLGEIYEHMITFIEKKYECEFAGVSQASLEWLRHFHIYSDTVFYNAIDLAQVDQVKERYTRDYRIKNHIPSSDIVIAFVGRMTYEKGIIELEQAFHMLCRQFPQVWLVAVGEGYLLDDLIKRKNDHMIYTGLIPHDNVLRILLESDIFCLPSVSEGFPTCVLEAAICDNYIITTHRGGAREFITDQSYGTILPDNHAEGVYYALEHIIEQREERTAAIAKCGMRVRESYCWEKTAEELITYISELDNRGI